MAQQFVDADITTEKESMVKKDGSALTTGELYTPLTRISERILQLEA